MRKREESCCGCGACAEICHRNAIHMVQNKEGFYYPQKDRKLCVECGRCVQVCPFKDQNRVISKNQYFGMRAKSEEIRYSSSSGGIFSVLAQFILSQQGVVYGAGYDVDMRVRHKEIASLSQLAQIRRTKYVQSSMSGIYSGIERRLAEDRWVLFCGTPCQAQALRNFLGRSYEKLVTIDLVCYGVPSPGIWNDYVKYLERKHEGKMTDFSFRDKRNRDNGQTCSYIIDGKEYVSLLHQDKYCVMYFSDLILRPSCHKCGFCTTDRGSDFTIGDFWGIERVRADLDDGMGMSMVITHTSKAETLWNQVKKEGMWFACKEEELKQPQLCSPAVPSKLRGCFILLYKMFPFSTLMGMLEIALNVLSKKKRLFRLLH